MSTQTLTIEFSLDQGRTWHFGMQRPDNAKTDSVLDEFRSVVRYSQRRHGQGVATRVVRSTRG
jgi:hypothetical protein